MGKVIVGVARNIVDPTGSSSQYLQKKTTGTMLLDILRTNRFSEITSIGHTDDYTAVAVSGSIVGVDIEEIVPVLPETDTYVRSFLQEEFPYLDMVADDLFIEWTAYEAWYKIGCIDKPIFSFYKLGSILITICMDSEPEVKWKFFDLSVNTFWECLPEKIGLEKAVFGLKRDNDIHQL